MNNTYSKIAIAVVTAMVCILSASAQHRVFAPEVGLTFSKLNAKYDDVTFNSKTKSGIRFGFLLDARLSDNLSLQPGLYLVQLGGKNSYFAGGYNGFQKQKILITTNYVQVPLVLVYKLRTKIPGVFFFGAGPYVGYAINGTFKEGSATVDLKFGDEIYHDIKSLDYGAELRTGYEAPFGLFARVGYQIGLANIDPTAEGDDKATNRNFYIAVGYFLGKSKKKTPTE